MSLKQISSFRVDRKETPACVRELCFILPFEAQELPVHTMGFELSKFVVG